MEEHALMPPPYATESSQSAPVSWPRKLAKILDDYGLDALIGFLLPGAGDAITGVAALTLLVHGLRERVPTVILFRMLLNILVDTVVGFVPVLGDLFDLFFRSNKRNLELIEQYAGGDRDPSVGDYAIVVGGVLLIVLAVMTPFLLLGALGYSVAGLLS